MKNHRLLFIAGTALLASLLLGIDPWRSIILSFIVFVISWLLNRQFLEQLSSKERSIIQKLKLLSGVEDKTGTPAVGQTIEHELDVIAEIKQKHDRRSQRLRRLFEILPLGLMRVRKDKTVGAANALARDAFGITFDPTNHPFPEVIRSKEIALAVNDAIDQKIERLGIFYRLPGDDKELEVDVRTLEDDSLIIIHDITRIRRLERARREFLVDVSHELRTPLTSVRAFTETLLAGGLDDNANRKKFVEIVLDHAIRMEALLDDVSELAQMETPNFELKREWLGLSQKSEKIIASLTALADSKNVDLFFEGKANFEIHADPQRIDQILTNLIENAIKFNREHGQVKIKIARSETGVALHIQDTGIGIAKADIPSIFHRFFRVDKARMRTDGTGLGLAIVKHLVRQHEWSIQVESELGEGTTFTLAIPAHDIRDA